MIGELRKYCKPRTTVVLGTEEWIKSRTESLTVKKEVKVVRLNPNGTYTEIELKLGNRWEFR